MAQIHDTLQIPNLMLSLIKCLEVVPFSSVYAQLNQVYVLRIPVFPLHIIHKVVVIRLQRIAQFEQLTAIIRGTIIDAVTDIVVKTLACTSDTCGNLNSSNRRYVHPLTAHTNPSSCWERKQYIYVESTVHSYKFCVGFCGTSSQVIIIRSDIE